MNLEKDSEIVAKAAIFDSCGKLLVLQRGDEGTKWDLPGGHVKNKEAIAGAHGVLVGMKREVYEETGLELMEAEKVLEFDNEWKCVINPIHLFEVNLSESEPCIDLTVQDFQENIAYVWVDLNDICPFLQNCTYVFEYSVDFLKKKYLFEQKEPWYKRKRRQERGMKAKLVGGGGNQHIPAKGMKKASTKRSKSGPPGSPLEESQPTNSNKKINVKIIRKHG